MKKPYLLFLLILMGVRSLAQQSPQQFFNKVFLSLKTKDTDGFMQHFASDDQFKLLAFTLIHVKKVTQDSLDNADGKLSGAFRAKMGMVFSMILKKADSLHVDLSNSQYVDCEFTEVKDTGMLCTSLTGALYFKSGDHFYQMKVNEAVLIKGEWRIIDPGELSVLTDSKFLSGEPNKVSAFGTFSKSKVKVKAVVLHPPPPISKQAPPPPPPEPKKKKKGN